MGKLTATDYSIERLVFVKHPRMMSGTFVIKEKENRNFGDSNYEGEIYYPQDIRTLEGKYYSLNPVLVNFNPTTTLKKDTEYWNNGIIIKNIIPAEVEKGDYYELLSGAKDFVSSMTKEKFIRHYMSPMAVIVNRFDPKNLKVHQIDELSLKKVFGSVLGKNIYSEFNDHEKLLNLVFQAVNFLKGN